MQTTEERVSDYESVLFARAMRLARSQSDAWDLVQDTYERALRGQATFQPGTNLRLWLMTIMYNLFLDRCRKQTREPRAIAIDEGDIPNPEAVRARAVGDASPSEQVHAAVADLEGPFREVYELRLISNCSYDEIADKLTIPRSTVGTRLLRARQKLKNRLLDLRRRRDGLGPLPGSLTPDRDPVAVGVAQDRRGAGRARAGRARSPRGRPR